MQHFISPEVFKVHTPRFEILLKTLLEMNLQLPRERLLAAVAELRSGDLVHKEGLILENVLLMLGRQRNPDDHELLRGQGDEIFAKCAMPGLLAWHGLEGYRNRLFHMKCEKGFAALNEAQRFHIAADDFEMNTMGIDDFFSDATDGKWRDALAGLKAMKRDELAAILQDSIAIFGDGGPSSDDETRRKQVDALEEKHAFDKLDARLKEAEDYWNLSLDRFAIEHAESFK